MRSRGPRNSWPHAPQHRLAPEGHEGCQSPRSWSRVPTVSPPSWSRSSPSWSHPRGVTGDRHRHGATRSPGSSSHPLRLTPGNSGAHRPLTDAVVAEVAQRVQARPKPDISERRKDLAAHRPRIEAWLAEGLTLVRVSELLAREGLDVPYTTIRSGDHCQE